MEKKKSQANKKIKDTNLSKKKTLNKKKGGTGDVIGFNGANSKVQVESLERPLIQKQLHTPLIQKSLPAATTTQLGGPPPAAAVPPSPSPGPTYNYYKKSISNILNSNKSINKCTIPDKVNLTKYLSTISTSNVSIRYVNNIINKIFNKPDITLYQDTLTLIINELKIKDDIGSLSILINIINKLFIGYTINKPSIQYNLFNLIQNSKLLDYKNLFNNRIINK